MDVTRTLKPGQPGTQKLTEHYGEQLVAVRYRQDAKNNRQLTTIELIIDERDPPEVGVSRHRELSEQRREYVALKIEYAEADLRATVKQAGARWDKQQKVWWLPREQVVVLRLKDRVVEGLECPDMDIWISDLDRKSQI